MSNSLYATNQGSPQQINQEHINQEHINQEHINQEYINQEYINQAVAQLQAGHVIAYPTEGVWGVGCDPYNQQAFEQLLQLKQRPIEKGVILLTGQIVHALPYLALVPEHIRHKILQTWPGFYTWILPALPNTPAWITGGRNTVAVRVSAHPLIQQLTQQWGDFVVSTSANPSSLPPAQTEAQTQQYFKHTFCLSGQTLGFNKPSSIADALTGDIIRA